MTVILVQFEASSAWMSDTGNSQYLNNRIEQDHRENQEPICVSMRGFGAVDSAARFCRCHDELRNLLHTNYHLRQTSLPATSSSPASFKEAALPSS